MTNNVHRLLKMYKIDTNFDFPKLYEDDMTETDVHNLV